MFILPAWPTTYFNDTKKNEIALNGSMLPLIRFIHLRTEQLKRVLSS